MRKLHLLCTLVLAILLGSTSYAQDFSNKGKDFWVAYGYHQQMTNGGNGGSQDMVLYFAAEQAANVTVSIPGLFYSQSYFVPANTVVTSAPIPKVSPDARLNTEGLTNKGIHVTSDKAIVTYAHVYNQSVSGATILFPTNTLGKEYYSVNYKNVSNTNNANCFFYVVATDTGTTSVRITPSANTIGGWLAGNTYNVTMTQGQVYNVMGQFTNAPPANPANGVDLTGSKIESVASASGGCKKIAVFSGSGRISITCNNNSSSSDNYMVQAFPKTAWGKKYLTVQAAGNQSFNLYRVCVTDPATVVKINGVVTGLPLQGGFYYEIAQTNQPQLIEADKPIMVAQYFSSQGSCGNGNPGDPEVIYLSPVEQNINKVLWNATPNFLITAHFFNAVIPNTGTAVSSFRLDGAVPAAAFITHPQDPGYVYLQQSVSAGPHVIQSDSGFNSMAYGFGNAESYGYNGGTNIRDLFQFIQLINPYGTVPFPATCRGTPFNFAMVFPYRPIQIEWIFGAPLNAMGINDTTIYNGGAPIIEDSTWVVAGRSLYRYKLPRTYFITAVGTYPIKVIATNPTPDGCGNEQTIDFDVQVFEPPIADFNFITDGCVTNPVNFFDNSNTGGRPIISRYWNFGDATTSNLAAPSHLYPAPGTYNVKYSLITDVGCLADTVIHPVALNDPPVALFTVSAPDCPGVPITFTDNSTPGPGATLVQWTWNFGDGGGPFTVFTNASQTHIYATAGTWNATLKVKTATGCPSATFTFPITIHAAPIADFSLPNVCLPGGAAQFNDLSTIAAGESITGWNWDFGDGSPPVINVQNPLHIYAGVGPYIVTLIVTSSNGCMDTIMKTLSTIYAEPQAAFTNPPEVCLGNSVTFIDNSTAPGSTVAQWTWNFGDGSPPVVVVAPNPPNQTYTYAATGTYTVTLNVISAIGCQTVNNFASHTVTVNPLPTGTISGTTAVCVNAPFPNITFTGASGTAPYTFTYTINGGPNQTVTSVGNVATVPVSTAVAGTFVYTLISVQDASATMCSQPQTGSATVIVNPLPTATISGTIAVCVNAPSPVITFTGAGATAPYTFTYNINGGPNQIIISVGNTATIVVSTAVAGTFTYNLVSVQDASGTLCSQPQTGSATVTVNPLPTATISGTIAVCVNAPSPNITFTGAGATAPYTFTYNLNGGPNLTITSVGNTATIAVSTAVAGTFTYNLVSVQDASGTLCSQPQTGSATVTVNPLPTATIAGTIAVCVNAPSPMITFTGAGATAPYTFTYNINGGPNQTITSVGNIATIAVSTATAGTFTYNLLSVQDASGTLCSQSQTGSATVTVNPLPTATISGNATVCLNAPSPTITFTGAGATAPYTFTYNINGGPNQLIVSVGNTATIAVPTNVAGTFVYNLLSVQDASPTACSQAQTGSATVIVHPLPTANFTFTAPSCETRVITFTDASIPNAASLTSWTWNFGDPGSGPLNTSNSQNPTHIYAAAGTYNVTLSVTNSNGCISNPVANIPVTINNRPKAGFMVPEVCINDIAAVFTDTSSIASGTFDPNGYVWDFGDGSPRTFTQNGTHLYLATGTYQVMHVVTSSLGCKDTLTQPITINGANPLAIFTVANPAALCANDSVAITNLSTVNFGNVTKLEIYWDFVNQPLVVQVDDFPFFGKVYKYLYPNFQAPLTRPFTIRMKAYSGTLCFNIVSQGITVNAAPLVQFNNMPNTCLDAAPFQITQASEIGGVPGTGVFSGPGVTPGGIFNPALVGPGTYTITYTFTSATGGCVDAKSKTITVYAPPSADFSFSAPNCENQAITFSDNSITPVGSLTTWTWNFADGTPILVRNNSAPFTHVFANWGVYAVKLKVTTSNGCISVQKVINVTVNPIPKPNFSMPASSCLPNASVSFGNLSTIADGTQATLNYFWNFGDPASGNNTSTQTNPSHIYTGTGPFSVNLQVTSANNCMHDTTIILNTIHPQPLASFTVDKIDVCIGGSFDFNNTSNPLDGTITQYIWTMDDGNGQTAPTFTYTYSAVGTYNVSLVIFNSNGCLSTKATKTVFVNPYPPVNAGPDKFMLEGGQVTLTPALNASMPVTYLWTPPQYLSDPTIAYTIASPPDDKTYTLRVTTDKGCSATDQVFIKVLKAPAIPNIFSPNGDGIHDTWVIQYLESYPGCTVDIFNRYGQQIYHSEGYTKPWDGTINGNPVPIGTYYYIVNPKNGRKQMSGYVDVIR